MAQLMSKLEDDFYSAWIKRNPNCVPERQYKFHPTRKYRADFAFPQYKVLVEIQGGSYTRGAHHTPKGYSQNCLRQIEATILGWRMIYFDTILMKNPNRCVELTEKVVYGRD